MSLSLFAGLLAFQPAVERPQPGCEHVLCGRRIERPNPVGMPPRLVGTPAQGALLSGNAGVGARVMLEGNEIPVAPDGRFILGFDRDHGPSARLAVIAADGATREQLIRVTPRAWPVQNVNMARPSTGPTPEYARLRESELVRIGAARRARSASSGWSQRLIPPARGRISGVFGSQRVYRGVPAAYHSGLDIAAGAGAPVIAPADGVVTLAPPPAFSLEGNLVIIDHGMGLTSAFLHLSRASVRVGQRVRQGEEIGRVGATGRATGPHLHWSLVWNGARLDPLAALDR
ncbi:M23 family metallopeptidase [Sphingosinicella sp.]|uniref:M23 family metallopeptidase n=1 Tax=Sphingosinicella sp. TaxID=1917971 RepID=UPI004038240A